MSMFIIALLNIIFIVILVFSQIRENFEINVKNTKCSEYLKKNYNIDKNNITNENYDVIADLHRATLNRDTVDGYEWGDINACVFPKDLLNRYKIKDINDANPCSWKDPEGNDIMPQLIPVGSGTNNPSIGIDGCMLDFNSVVLV